MGKRRTESHKPGSAEGRGGWRDSERQGEGREEEEGQDTKTGIRERMKERKKK